MVEVGRQTVSSQNAKDQPTPTAEMNGFAVIQARPTARFHPLHARCFVERIVWMITHKEEHQIPTAGNFS